jgi:uncharacterized membrane protein
VAAVDLMAAARQEIGEMHFLKRFFRHVLMSPLQVRRAFPQKTLDQIERAVGISEASHRGQVRFVVEAELTTWQLWADVSARQRAIDVFSGLRVWDTSENNGVLVYVLLADRKVEIIADRGIHKHVGAERWQAICKELEHFYRKGDFAAGSITAIEKITVELTHYFPSDGVQVNEQPNQPVVM